MEELRKKTPLATAAARAGMSEPTARKWRAQGKLPSEMERQRDWRTRADPFEELWPEVEALLAHDPGLQAKTVFEELQRRHPGQLRTLQRRFRAHSASECKPTRPKEGSYVPDYSGERP